MPNDRITAPQRAGAPAAGLRCGPSPRRATSKAATSASADEASTTPLHGKPAPAARTAWGSAVPSVNMPTSHASASPARAGAQLTTSFIPIGYTPASATPVANRHAQPSATPVAASANPALAAAPATALTAKIRLAG